MFYYIGHTTVPYIANRFCSSGFFARANHLFTVCEPYCTLFARLAGPPKQSQNTQLVRLAVAHTCTMNVYMW